MMRILHVHQLDEGITMSSYAEEDRLVHRVRGPSWYMGDSCRWRHVANVQVLVGSMELRARGV